MTIHLPDDLASRIRAEVHLGRFASEDEAVAEAVRHFFDHRRDHESAAGPDSVSNRGMGMNTGDDADLLDRIREDIMRSRRSRILRLEATPR